MTANVDQVLALAPDAASAKAGQGLASARKWRGVGRSAQALWGLCQGSGKDPYQVTVALPDLASACSCPSRKFPCKHALGLMLLHAAEPGAVTEGEPPAFVQEWLAKREARTQKKLEREQAAAPADPQTAARQAAKREAQRDERLAAGMTELRAWIEDLVAAGFAHAPVREPEFWDVKARRLVDAQAQGLARQVADLAGIALTEKQWPEKLLGRLARIHLAAEAFERRADLPLPLRADVARVLGVAQRQDDVDKDAAVEDDWLCLAQIAEEIDRLQMQRTWLLGRGSASHALILTFAPLGQPLASVMVPGSQERMRVAFFPGNAPLRAVIVERGGNTDFAPPAPRGVSIADALQSVAQTRAADAWAAPLPLLLHAQLRCDHLSRWWLIDAGGRGLPVRTGGRSPWEWVAAARGRHCTWFGEWDDSTVSLANTWVSGAEAIA